MAPATNIRYATEADIPALGIINHEAFASSTSHANAFPNAAPGSIRSFKAAQSLKHLVNPRMHALTGCDPASDEVIASCRWIIPQGLGYDREPATLSEQGKQDMADPKRFAPPSMNEPVYKAFAGIIEEKRKQYTTEEDFSMFILFFSDYFIFHMLDSIYTNNIQSWISWPHCPLIRAKAAPRHCCNGVRRRRTPSADAPISRLPYPDTRCTSSTAGRRWRSLRWTLNRTGVLDRRSL